MRDIAAAVIKDGDKIMICRRPANKGNALLWEFPGGKIEEGETIRECLIRECREELDVTVKVGEHILDTVHQYPDILVRVRFFYAEIESGTLKMKEHCDIQWVEPKDFGGYDFCPADVDILKYLKGENGI